MEKIKEATQEQWDRIAELKETILNAQCDEIKLEDVQEAVNGVWKRIGLDADKVTCVQAESPSQAKKKFEELNGSKDTQIKGYWSVWWRTWAGWYKGAEILGVVFDQDTLQVFSDWCRCVPYIIGSDELVVVSKNPTKIHWDDNNELHNEKGMSVEYSDGWGCWSLNGVAVDERIVMRPETQTVEQINAEENEEIKRIRIERFGWDQYLTDINAKCIDQRENSIESTREMLFDCNGMKLLRTFCPSTGKIFALEVDPAVMTCSQAQSWLWQIDSADTDIVGRT